MDMSSVLAGVIGYLLLGAILLVAFDLATKRIRAKLTQAASETQSRLAASGNYVGGRLAFVLFLGVMWLFWPMVFVGTVTDKKEGDDGA